MNAYLKEVADLSGVEKHLTFKVARVAFDTLVTMANGIPIESVRYYYKKQILEDLFSSIIFVATEVMCIII